MSVYNRPLFRQMGGPAQPMPQDMAPPAQQLPPEAAMLQQVEQVSAAQGQELGKAYAEQMMQGIDAAQSTEELINAFRGNEMPLDARRDELADYVGQGDADQTPESVLAMVQPVIMMTEEGAMNSGIGNLMQQLTGDIDMMTEAGQPTDMGQGVGSLMMAGAPEAPAPQNFRQGGEVAFLQDASSDTDTAPPESFKDLTERVMTPFSGSISQYYKDMSPLFSEIIGDAEESRRYNQGQTFFDVARAGLAYAAGVDPSTGKSMTNRPQGSQLASAFSTLPASIQERVAEQRKLDQGVRSAALQQAASMASLERKAEYDYLSDVVAARLAAGRRAADLVNVIDSDGRIVNTVDLNDRSSGGGYDIAMAASKEGLQLESAEQPQSSRRLTNQRFLFPGNKSMLLQTPDEGLTYIIPGENKTLTQQELFDRFGEPLSVVSVSDEVAATVQDKAKRVGQYQELLDQYQKGDYTPFTGKAGESTPKTSGISALQQSQQQGSDFAEYAGGESRPLNVTDEEFNKNVIAGAFTYTDGEGRQKVLNVVDASLGGLGPVQSLRSGLRSVFGFVQDKLPAEAAQREMFRQYLRAVAFTGKVALVSSARFPVAEMTLAQQILANPDTTFQDPKVAAQNWEVVKRVTDRMRGSYLTALANPLSDDETIREAQLGLARIDVLDDLMGPVNIRMPSPTDESRFDTKDIDDEDEF